MSVDITFFGRERRNNSLRKSVKNRRSIVKTMLDSNSPLSIREISNKADVPYAVTFDTIQNFVKSGFVASKLIALYKARKDSKYELTKSGKMIALVVNVDENRVLGNRRTELQNIFQPERGTDALNLFTNTVMLNAINHGLDNFVLRFLRNTIEFLESLSEPANPLRLAEKAVGEALPSEIKALKDSIVQALSSLSELDKDVVVQYYRNATIQMLFGHAMQSHDLKIQRLATMSQRDQDGIYIPFKCKCDYMNDQLYVKMEDVLVKIFTGGWECPSCLRIVSDKQTKIRNNENPKIQLHSR